MSEGIRRDPPDLGGRLLALRKDRRLTLDRLAAASGVSKSMLSQIERGRVNPTVATLWNLTQALGIDIGELLGTPAGVLEGPPLEHLKAHATPAIASADERCSLRILNPPRQALSFEWYEMAVEPGGALRSEAARAGRARASDRSGGGAGGRGPGEPNGAERRRDAALRRRSRPRDLQPGKRARAGPFGRRILRRLTGRLPAPSTRTDPADRVAYASTLQNEPGPTGSPERSTILCWLGMLMLATRSRPVRSPKMFIRAACSIGVETLTSMRSQSPSAVPSGVTST